MAFQANAFQSDAFQICASTKPDIPLQRRIARRREEEEARRRYEEALELLKKVEDKKTEAQLEAVILPFKKEEEVDISALMMRGQAKRKFEQILLTIRQLEEDYLEILALLLLANEAL